MTSLPIELPQLPPLQYIGLETIDFDHDFFRMSFEPDLEKLTQSMNTVGLINPPLLRGTPPYQIISGYRRAETAKRLGWKTIPVRVYPLSEMDNGTALKVAFFENAGTRAFNLIEAAAIACRFLDSGTDNLTVQIEILPIMGLQPNRKVLQQLLSLTNLINQWKSYVVHRGLVLANGTRISRLSPQEQTTLFKALSPLKLGHNKMSQCLDMVEDIQKGEGLSLVAIFETGGFDAVLSDEKCTITEKTTLFRRVLRARRYPALTGMEEQFQHARKKLTLPPAVRLDPPPFFEGNRLSLSGSVRSPEELREIAAALYAAAENEGLKEMIEML